MFLEKISASKSDIIDQCLWRYYLRYVLKLPGYGVKNEGDMNFGSFLHKVFELGAKETHIKELQKISESVRGNYGIKFEMNSKINICLENFIQLNSKLGETLSTELQYEVELDTGIIHNGVIDRIIKGNSGGLLIIDYKSGKREKTRVDLLNDKQLTGYAYACHKLYKVEYKDITCAHYYPLTNNLVTVKIPESFVNKWRQQEISKVWRIRKKKANEFHPQQNNLCDYCDHKPSCIKFCTQEQVDKSIAEQKLLKQRLDEEKKANEETKT